MAPINSAVRYLNTSAGRESDQVQSVAPTPPPSGTILFQEGFENTSFAARGWYDNTSPSTSTVEHTPTSTRSLQMTFNSGATSPVNGGAMRMLFAAQPAIYLSYWVKYSTNWVGSGSGDHPHEFHFMSNLDGDFDGPSENWLTLYIEQNYQNGGIPRLAVQDNLAINTSFGTPPHNLIGVTENRSTCGCNGVIETGLQTECFAQAPWYNDKRINDSAVRFQPTAGPGYKNNWNFVEAYFKLNTISGGIGQADGVAQYWFNGAQTINRQDILYVTGARPTLRFHQFLIAPFISDGSPATQTFWVDDLTVATGRVP